MSDAKRLIDMLHKMNNATGERWFAYRDALTAGIEQQAEKLAAANEATAKLRAEVERRREDAERYLLVRSQEMPKIGVPFLTVIKGVFDFEGCNLFGDAADAAIDAARKPEPRMWYSKKDDPTNWNTDPYDTSTGMKIARPTRKE